MKIDNIDKPLHYLQHPSGVECIDITKHLNFCLGNAIKYIWRAGLKDSNATVEDLKKARKYLDFELQRIQELDALLEKCLGKDDE